MNKPIRNHNRLAKTQICSSHMVISFLISISLFLGFTSNSFGSTQQVLIFGNNDTAASGVVEYNVPAGSDSYDPVEANRLVMWPSSGTIDDLRVEMQTSPQTGAGTQSFTMTLRIDVGCDGIGEDTSLACTISEDEVACNNSSGFSVNAGECVSMSTTPSGTPGRDDMWWSITFTPTTADETVMVSNDSGTSLATSGTQYLAIHAGTNPTTVSFDRSTLIPTGGTFKNLYVALITPPGVGSSRTFAFGTVDCTITDLETTCNSSGDTQAVTAGEKYALTSTVGGTPLASLVYIGIVFDPTTEGEWIIAFSNDDDLNATTTEYHQLNVGGAKVWTATEADTHQLVQTGSFAVDMIIKNMYVELEADPGATGDKFTFRLRANVGDASAQLECDLDGVQTCNSSATVVIADDDLMNVRVIPTSTPAVGPAIMSYTGFITPVSDARRIIFI